MRRLPKILGIGALLGVLAFLAGWFFVPDFDLRIKNLYRKVIQGNTYPVCHVAAHPIGDQVLLTWEIPGDPIFQEVELYFTEKGTPSRASTRIPTPNPESNYLWWTPPAGVDTLHFAVFAKDKNQQYAEGEVEHLLFQGKPTEAPEGIFSFSYNYEQLHATTLLPYYELENEQLRVLFAYGVPIGIENKQSDMRATFQIYGALNSFFKDMDIWEKIEGRTQDMPVLSTYLEAYGAENIWLETYQDSLNMRMVVQDLERGPLVEARYELDSNKLRFHLQPLNDSKYMARFNVTGDANYKAVTHWETQRVYQVVGEGEVPAVVDASSTDKLDYQHKDGVFNDTYPYLNSRIGLSIGDSTVFRLYHDDTELFRLHKISGTNDFIYKNCTGEENFSFGTKAPYDTHSPEMEGPFSFELEVVY